MTRLAANQRHPLRILILHSRYLSGWASGENGVVRDEGLLLSEAGHYVVTWTPAPTARQSRSRLAASAVWSGSAVMKVRDLIDQHQPDIIHCHNLFPMLSPAVLRAAKDGATRVVVTLHNYRMSCLPATFIRDGEICERCLGHLPWRGVAYRCYRDSLPGSAVLAASLSIHRSIGSYDHVSLFLPVSRFVRDKHAQAGLATERMQVKPNFCWAKPRRNGLGEYFLYAGRLAPEKDLRTLLEAWRSIREPLVIAGDGPEREALQRLAPKEVEFRGTVPAEEVTELLQRARALLLPTKCNEGGPRSIIEAYAAGVPVIGTALGALPELIADGQSGLLVPPRRSDAWVAAVQSMRESPTAGRLAAGAHDLWSRRYGPQHGLRALEQAYHATLAS